MRFLIAGILAAAVSWVGNRAMLRLLGTQVIVVMAPFIEETAKSGSAALVGSPLLLTHGIFGLIEGFYDAWNSGWQGMEAGIASLTGHLFFGYITYLVLTRHHIFWLAVLTGYTVHMLWNITVMKFMVRKRRISS